jgi:hypothetical protein
MLWIVPFQIGLNVHRRRSQNWTAFHVIRQWWCWESARCDSWKSLPNCPWSFWRSTVGIPKSLCRTILTKNWRCIMLPQNLWHIFWQMSKTWTMSQSGAVWSFKCWWKLSEKCHNRWWNMGVGVLYQNKSAVIIVGGKIHFIVDQMWRCCWFFWLEGCPSWVCSMWSDSQWTVLLGGHDTYEGGSVKEEAWGVEKQDLDAAPQQNTCSHVALYP